MISIGADDHMKRPFHQLDVFTAIPLMGNPLAVVHEALGLDDARMAAFARWINLSETTFLYPPTHPDADYKVRIFTPRGELPFAGHPTLGSCHAWLAEGGIPKNGDYVVQECGIGLVQIRRDSSRLAFAAPPLIRTGELEEEVLDRIALGIGVDKEDFVRHQWIDNGPGWCGVMLSSAEKVLEVRPDLEALGELRLGLIGPYSPGYDVAFEVRAFVPSLGVPEDPVTGSLNGAFARWLIPAGLCPAKYIVSQGGALGRDGRIHVEQVGDYIWIGGDVARCVEGSVTI